MAKDDDNDNDSDNSEQEHEKVKPKPKPDSDSPLRRSKRKARPTTKQAPECESPIRHRKKRQRKLSRKDEEEKAVTESSAAQKESMVPKRKYKKRQKKDAAPATATATRTRTEKADNGNANGDSNETGSLDDSEMFCCICQCTVDYSDKDQFHWPEEIDSDSDSDDDGNSDGDDDGEGEHDNSRSQDTTTRVSVSVSASAVGNGNGNGNDNVNGSQVSDMKESSIVSREKEESMNSHSHSQSVPEKNGTHENDESSSSSEESDFYGVKLPNNMYDPNNALLICDGDGCNRCYHQRCHFTPVLSVPRREWFCLICQYKDKLKSKTKAKRGRKPKYAPTDQGDSDDGQEGIVELSKSVPLTIDEVDTLYRAAPKAADSSVSVDANVDANAELSSPSKEKKSDLTPTHTAITLEERFEFHTAQLKSDLIRKGSQQMVKLIDQNLSSVRLCQNSLRTLIETNGRARKSLIEKYNRTHQLPQELVQNVTRMARCKLRLRNVFHTLQYVIQNKDDRQELFEWFSRARSEGRFTPAKICTSKRNLPVPEIISLESSATEQSSVQRRKEEIDIDALEAKLFVGDVSRREPRFDIKDYDADEDDSEASDEDLTNKIKCSICFSGHVEEDNDVIMCDGMKCFRAIHMKCCAPHVTQNMLDDDEHGVWFCPFCVCSAKTIHYAQTEYHGEHDDDASVKSWEHAEEVFPEAKSELKAAEKWKEGNRNDSSDEILADMLGIEIAKAPSSNVNDDDDVSDGDESDASFASENISRGSASMSDSDEASGVNWDVGAEAKMLSCSESESDSEDESDRPRRSRRLEKSMDSSGVDSEPGPASTSDVGKLDTSNIVRGKRTRGQVDYNR